MFDFLKYFPVEAEWRLKDEYCVPRGPTFSYARWITIPIGGSRLRLKVPRHRPFRSTSEQKRLLPGTDVIEGRELASYSVGVMANDDWRYSVPLARRWAFWGPWMTGCKGELTMSVSVLARHTDSKSPPISFFQPKAFEMVLVEYLNDRYGHEHWDVNTSIPRHHGPVDWQRHRNLPVFSASCKVYHQGPDPDITNNLSFPDHLFFFPITDEHFVEICFVQHLYSRDKEDNIAFDATPLQTLQDEIFNSISLELSSQAQASYDKVKSQCRNMQLSKEFAPLQWPTGIDRQQSMEAEKVALAKGV